MNTKTRALWLTALLGLLLAAGILLAASPAQAALPAASADRATPAQDTLRATTMETVTTFVISNEAPGHLVDYLINQGHGNETLFQVLGYLKAQSGGIIPDEWYNQVADPQNAGKEVFTAHLSNYAGLEGGIEIGADGTVSIPSVEGKDYVGVTGYGTAPSQNGQFGFNYAEDAAHYVLTHIKYRDFSIYYYAFAIAWREGYRLFLPLVVRNAP